MMLLSLVAPPLESVVVSFAGDWGRLVCRGADGWAFQWRWGRSLVVRGAAGVGRAAAGVGRLLLASVEVLLDVVAVLEFFVVLLAGS